jgi:hypothetical protein
MVAMTLGPLPTLSEPEPHPPLVLKHTKAGGGKVVGPSWDRKFVAVIVAPLTVKEFAETVHGDATTFWPMGKAFGKF